MPRFFERFEVYFQKPVACTAAQSMADGVEVEFRIQTSGGEHLESFTFTRKNQNNACLPKQAAAPQLIFFLTPEAAETLLSDPSEDIGVIGVSILKMLFSADANRKIHVQLKTGFLTLFQKGYFGVIQTGGALFAGQLASMGFSGMGAIRSAIKKLRGASE